MNVAFHDRRRTFRLPTPAEVDARLAELWSEFARSLVRTVK